MVTVFSIPKDFDGDVGVLQRNAIHSWRQTMPDAQLVLLGPARGAREVAADVGAEHIPDIACNERGTPFVSDGFSKAAQQAKHEVLCYLNADIVLTDDVSIAAKMMPFGQYVLISRRWELQVESLLDFSGDWAGDLRHRVGSGADLAPPTAMDCFMLPRNSPVIANMPTFLVGRAGWDNWMVRFARSRRIPVVDATATVLLIHQEHGYGHVPDGTGQTWAGPESDYNLGLHGPDARAMTVLDATHMTTAGGLRRTLTWTHMRHRARVLREAVALGDRIPGLRALARVWRNEKR